MKFTEEQVDMYFELIFYDEAMRKCLMEIGKRTDKKNNESGITVSQLTDIIKVKRPVQKGKTFKQKETNINRKHVERILSTFQTMGLCYYRSIPPSKVFYLTYRGKQITYKMIQELKKKHVESELNMKGE